MPPSKILDPKRRHPYFFLFATHLDISSVSTSSELDDSCGLQRNSQATRFPLNTSSRSRIYRCTLLFLPLSVFSPVLSPFILPLCYSLEMLFLTQEYDPVLFSDFIHPLNDRKDLHKYGFQL